MQDSQAIVHQAEEFQGGPDKLFGICLAIGEDLGFDPFYLRVALIGLMVFSPAATIGAYVALGGVVLLSRCLFPKARQAAVAEESLANEGPGRTELPLAA